MSDLVDENRVLRERIAQLEAARGDDPVFKELLEHFGSYIHVVTPEGRIVAAGRVNQAFGSVIGRSAFEFTDPSCHDVMREAFQRAAATGQPVVHESIAFGENGEPNHTYLVQVVPLEGAPPNLLVIPTDITERVRLERTLVESEQALRLALDATRIGLWRWDVATDRIHWDARTLQIFGVTEAPATYAAYLALLHPDDRERVQRVVTESLNAGANPTFEHRIVRPPGEPERWALCVMSMTRDAAGQISQLLGGVLDISEQKRFEAQLQRAERVEALGQLTAGIAHNFNNLLAAIVPNLELVIASAPEHCEPLVTSLDAALQARDLIRSLMTLSGRRPSQPVDGCAAAQIVRQVESICRLTFPREIELVTTIEAEPYVAMPATDLEQVLLNLLFNARDAVVARGGTDRRIEIAVDRSATREVRIRVRDSGIGMTEAVRTRIFEAFFTTKPPHEGSGLGLSTALERVREAGGSLACDSAPGSGTVFTARLPEIDPPADHAVSPTAKVERSRGGEVILIVDDESMVRSAVNRLLTTQDYEVVEAESAADARAVLERDGARIDLVILDQSMPTESGIEALASLRARSNAPVILFTGVAHAVPAGVAAVIEKPARPGELFKVVRLVLDAQHAP